jgi:hypothetical protein
MWDDNWEMYPSADVIFWNGKGRKIRKGKFNLGMTRKKCCEYYTINYRIIKWILKE